MTGRLLPKIRGKSVILLEFVRKHWPPRQPGAIDSINTRQKATLSPEKQKQLNELCEMLFKRQELITSGKLQLIGLSAIKKRLGKRWAGLSQIIYDTTEDVIRKHTDKNDLFIRYQDETYLILFTRGTLAEGTRKSEIIAEEIRARLFALDEEELRKLEIRQTVRSLSAGAFRPGKAMESMNSLFGQTAGNDAFVAPVYTTRRNDIMPEIDTADAAQVSTANHKPPSAAKGAFAFSLPELECAYIPLWDVPRNSINLFLCLSRNAAPQGELLDAHMALCRHVQGADKIKVDLKMLEIARKDVERIAAAGNKAMIVVPVQYETLVSYENYEMFKAACAAIPADIRRFIGVLVLSPESGKVAKDAYWFARPMHNFIQYVFAIIPMTPNINVGYLSNVGIDAVGVRLAPDMNEQATLAQLNTLCAKAKSYKIPYCFALDVPSLSLTTSIVCAGFDYVSGKRIHAPVPRVDAAIPFSAENLIRGLPQG